MKPSDPQHLVVVVRVSNPSILKVKTGETEIQGHPLLHSEFEASLMYMKPVLKIKLERTRMSFNNKNKKFNVP